VAGSGDFTINITAAPALKIKKNVKVFGDVTYEYDRTSGGWQFNFEKKASSSPQAIRVQYQGAVIESEMPDYLVSGKGVADKGDISFSASYPQITVYQDGIKGNGKLDLDGTLNFAGKELQGQMQADLQKGRIEFTDKGNVIDGIALLMQFPSLPQIKTDVDQVLRFSDASIGNFSITDGKVKWQLESADSLFINKSEFKWAGGDLYVNDVRLSSGKDQQFITILCDGLKLIEVLQQFGIANAEGEGTVSGKVPLLLGKNTLDFEEGLLSSNPGEGGRIRISAFDLLAAGIPKDSPQFAEIDFTAEALKNFKYKWVKLYMHTTGEDLVMQLQMEGRPMQTLPFSYNNKTGTFARFEGSGQGINQPIRLDVNFRFPLNRVLRYTGRIQDLLNRLKQ
jgi:cytoskeletal protein CcmA (bactofilin family)